MITQVHTPGSSATLRPGAALPLVLLMTVVLTMSLAVAFQLTGSEIRVVDDHKEQNEAFVLAESGRERFMADRNSFGLAGTPAASESVRVNFTNGYADVVLTRIRPASQTAPALYVLRSRGVRTVPRRYNVPVATRTVAELMSWQSGNMNVRAAWTSLSGLHKNGGSGTLSGTDGCGAAGPVSGVAVPANPGYTQNGGSSVPSGSPPILNLGNQQAANDSIRIDWDGIKNEGALTPDITIPGGSWPSFANPSYWPTIMVHGDFSLPGSGRGLLIVTGDLTISGSKSWDGVVLVGQNITSNGNNGVQGAAITGLDMKLGIHVPEGDVGNGTKLYQYNSCNVAAALAGLGGLVPYRNAWSDNWSMY